MEKLCIGKGSLCSKLAALAILVAGATAQPVQAQDIMWAPIQQIEPGLPTESVIALRPRIANDARGNVIAVYTAKDNGLGTPDASQLGVQVLRSNSNGTSWLVPAQQLSIAAAGVRPDIATDTLGNWLVVWASEPASALSSARSTDNGSTWAGAGTVSAAFPQLSNNQNIAIATNHGGTWMAAWLADDTANATSTIALARSVDNGTSWQPVGTLPAPETSAAPSIAGDPSDGFVVAYEKEAAEGQTDDSEIAFAQISSSGIITTSGLVNTDAETDVHHEFAPSVTVSSSGAWAISWARQSAIDASDWHVAGVSASDGATWSDPQTMSFPPGTNFTAGALADPSSAYGEAGRLVTLWTSTESTPDVPRDIFYNFQRTSDLEVNQSRLDLDFDLLGTPYFNRPHVAQVAGGRWLGLWQRLEVIPDGKELSASSPWFSHGMESGIAAGDAITTTDLSITKTAWPDPAISNGDLGYVITVRNIGNETANLVAVTDPLPANVTFSHAVVSQGTWSQGTVNGANTLVAQLGSIAPGRRATLAIAVKPTAGSGTVTNTAMVEFIGDDLDPANNTATVTSAIGGGTPPDPTNPTDPNPTNPDNPTDPTDPTDPLNPGDPITPVEPVNLLELTTSDLKIKGKEPKPGKPAKPYKLSLKALAANITTAATPETNIEVYISDDATLDSSDQLLSGKKVKSVKPGKALKLKLSAKVEGNPTGRYLILVISGQSPVAVPIL